jgi:hypothetical protein
MVIQRITLPTEALAWTRKRSHMAQKASLATTPSLASPDDLASLLPSWVRSQKAANLAPRTIVAYSGSLESLRTSLTANGRPTDVTLLSREHLENWLVEMLEACASASTAAHRYRGVQQFLSGPSKRR